MNNAEQAIVNWLNMREAVAFEFAERRGMAVRVAEILNRDRSNLRSTAVQVRGWVSGLYVPRAKAAAKLMAAIEQARKARHDFDYHPKSYPKRPAKLAKGIYWPDDHLNVLLWKLLEKGGSKESLANAVRSQKRWSKYSSKEAQGWVTTAAQDMMKAGLKPKLRASSKRHGAS